MKRAAERWPPTADLETTADPAFRPSVAQVRAVSLTAGMIELVGPR
jgi:hypothetical protein